MSAEPIPMTGLSMPIADLFDRQVGLRGDATAVESARLQLSYAALDGRAWRMVQWLLDAGVCSGDRVCVLTENDPDFVVLSIAALRLGVVVATLNPRLSEAELRHCVSLVSARALLISDRHAERCPTLGDDVPTVARIGGGTKLDEWLSGGPAVRTNLTPVDPETVQYIIYTSGTTGLPKGAMISHRAMLARLMVYVLDYGITAEDTFLAWSPLCHMASVELAFGTLLLGGKVVVIDGADLPTLCDYLERDFLSNLIVFPGMVEQTVAYLRERRPKVRRLRKFGALADLFRPEDIATLTSLLGVPFTNTFGSTETGMPPLSAGTLPIGQAPVDLGKSQSALCSVRLCDEDGREVPVGEPGELWMRGPTLFSGYWNAPAATKAALQNGWYRSGDVFRRRADGRFDYLDRRKYLIKSGGENVYPAEIERLVLRHPAVAEAVVVRRRDARWGEVPVLVVQAHGQPPDAAELLALCDGELAPFKRPKTVLFVSAEKLPRNGTGKIMRSQVEDMVQNAEPTSI